MLNTCTQQIKDSEWKKEMFVLHAYLQVSGITFRITFSISKKEQRKLFYFMAVTRKRYGIKSRKLKN